MDDNLHVMFGEPSDTLNFESLEDVPDANSVGDGGSRGLTETDGNVLAWFFLVVSVVLMAGLLIGVNS